MRISTGRNSIDLYLSKGYINCLNLIRLVAAITVLISHAWVMGFDSPSVEPLGAFTPFSLGQHAVHIFFLISGFLITRSWENRKSSFQYMVARASRIYPAIFVMLLLITPMVGLFASEDMRGFFLNFETYIMPAKTLLTLSGNLSFTDVFTSNPAGQNVNEPLWTLKYEIFCYFVVAGLGLIFRNYFRKAMTVIFILSTVSFIYLYSDDSWKYIDAYGLEHISRFLSIFALGSMLYFYRHEALFSNKVQLFALLAIILAHGTSLAAPIYAFGLGYLALGFGLKMKSMPLQHFSSNNDISFGIYIYGWPVTQILVILYPWLNGIFLCLAALAITGVIAMMSWILVEKPTLTRTRYLLNEMNKSDKKLGVLKIETGNV